MTNIQNNFWLTLADIKDYILKEVESLIISKYLNVDFNNGCMLFPIHDDTQILYNAIVDVKYFGTKYYDLIYDIKIKPKIYVKNTTIYKIEVSYG